MNADETEEMSVNDIDDFSFDDTQVVFINEQ